MRLRTLVLLCLLATPASAQEVLELVESFPVETTMDHPDLRDAYVVWREMIDRAEKTLDFAEFYASDDPANKQSRLETVTQAVERAAARGVKVRFLAEKVFQKTYPELLARLGAKSIEVRIYDFAAIAGGVLHAKYFLVDGRELYVGSQNFDWRSLEHIQELGARIVEPDVARAYADVFETDWALAGGGDKRNRTRSDYLFPAAVDDGGDTAQVTPVFSPTGWLPDQTLWDLPRLVEMIDHATRTVRVQLLTYKTTSRDGSYFDTLDAALRRAASRGVQVQLLLADWGKRKGTIEGLQSLEVMAGIDVRMSTIPPFSGGFVPFARVGHAKYMVVDGRRAWIGTGNWEGDYFTQSRNAGLVIDSPKIGDRLDRYFASAWGSTYAYDVDACATYEPPRVAE